MNLTYCRELEVYDEIELRKLLSISSKQYYNNIIEELIARKILVIKEEAHYCFEFVGVLVLSDSVLFCLPKYIHNSNSKTIAKQLLRLFSQYSKRESLDKEEVENIGSIESSGEYNMLSVIIFLLNDYSENGLYSNEKNVFDFNGDDEINWWKTIEDVQPIINNGEPIYLEYYANATQNDEDNYFRLLHMYVLNECTKKLSELGLDEFFGFEPVVFEVNEDSFGTPQGIVSRISNELHAQFLHRRQVLLKAMSSFISKEKMGVSGYTISLYGTRSFNLVWEKTCAYVLDNKYAAISALIDKPRWTTTSGNVHETKTLVPDIISINTRLLKSYFIISDAKYYSIELTNTILSGNPGIEDLTKQYLYQLAYRDYIKLHDFSVVQNVLLFPSENKMERIGTVSIRFLKELDLDDIVLIKIPASIVFEMYINGKIVDIETFLDLDITSAN